MDETTVTVTAVRTVGPDAVALDLEPPAGFEARPGQFVKLVADLDGERQSRFYTISSPDVDETVEVTVEVDPEGTLGPWLAEREPGDAVGFSGPYGDAYYEGESRVVVLAGGPGVGPAVGIAERALTEGNAAAVVYRDDEPMHEARLSTLSQGGAAVAIVRDDESLADAVRAVLGDGESEQVYVYGFAEFLDAATDAIAAAGGDPGEAKVENFG